MLLIFLNLFNETSSSIVKNGAVESDLRDKCLAHPFSSRTTNDQPETNENNNVNNGFRISLGYIKLRFVFFCFLSSFIHRFGMVLFVFVLIENRKVVKQ